MASRQLVVGQDSFEAGAFRDVAPDRIPDAGVLALLDGFVEEDGGAVERGGTVNKSDAAFGTSGRWIFDGYFDVGQRTVFANGSDFGVLDADDESVITLGSDGLTVPKPSALVAGMLFIGGGYIYAGSRMEANYATGTVTLTNGSKTVTGAGTTWNTLTDAGMLFQRGSERVYAVASIDSTTQLTLADPYEGATGAGVAYTLSPIYKITTADPYPDAEFYTVCANRLVWAETNLVHASEALKPHDLTATIGGAEVPTTHELPEGVRVTGLGTVGQTLLAFTTHGVWTIEGLAFDIAGPDGANQHRLQRHSGEVILWDGNGIASWEQALVVPCVDGIFLLDGVSQPLRISHPVDEQVMDYIGRSYKCGQAIVAHGHYILPVFSGTGAMRDQMVFRINRPIKSGGQIVYPFSHFARHAGQLIGFAVRVGTDTREPVLLGISADTDARIVECPFFEPDSDNASDANGEIVFMDVITRDYVTGNGTKNMVRHVRVRSEEVGADDPALVISESDGGASSGGAQFDIAHFDIDVFGESGIVYNDLVCTVKEEAAGVRIYRCRINKFRRHSRIRMRSRESTDSLKLRSVELFVRPSGARRH